MSTLGILLIVILIVACIGVSPRMPYATGWGMGWNGSGVIGIVLVIVIVLLLMGRL
jgi:hypothetical protein